MLFETPEQITAYRAITIKHALLLYDRTKMQDKNMLLAAEEITGKKFKRGQYKEAAAALDQYVQDQKQDAESFETVDIIASGYEWICPNCDHLNESIEITEIVECSECERKYTTGEPHHAHGTRR